MLETFVLYMLFGRIILHEQSAKEQLRLVDYLLELADYYCLEELRLMTQKHAVELFEQSLRARKASIKELIASALSIYRMEPDFGDYACLHALTALIASHSIESLD
jgi:hypothetical protein